MMAQRKPDSPSLRLPKWGMSVERFGGWSEQQRRLIEAAQAYGLPDEAIAQVDAADEGLVTAWDPRGVPQAAAQVSAFERRGGFPGRNRVSGPAPPEEADARLRLPRPSREADDHHGSAMMASRTRPLRDATRLTMCADR